LQQRRFEERSAVPRPALDELDHRALEAVAERTQQHSQGGAGLSLPSPVWTMINPLRRRAAAILPRISFCSAFISASCLVASVMGQLQVERNARARAHSKDSKMAAGVSTSSGRPSPTRRASLKQQHAVEVPGHPQIVQGHQQGGAAVRQPPRESEHLERMAHVELGDGLVPELQPGPCGERAGERHPMAFATAEPRHRTRRKLARSKAASASSIPFSSSPHM